MIDGSRHERALRCRRARIFIQVILTITASVPPYVTFCGRACSRRQVRIRVLASVLCNRSITARFANKLTTHAPRGALTYKGLGGENAVQSRPLKGWASLARSERVDLAAPRRYIGSSLYLLLGVYSGLARRNRLVFIRIWEQAV